MNVTLPKGIENVIFVKPFVAFSKNMYDVTDPRLHAIWRPSRISRSSAMSTEQLPIFLVKLAIHTLTRSRIKSIAVALPESKHTTLSMWSC